jgi:hypothetical protein
VKKTEIIKDGKRDKLEDVSNIIIAGIGEHGARTVEIIDVEPQENEQGVMTLLVENPGAKTYQRYEVQESITLP